MADGDGYRVGWGLVDVVRDGEGDGVGSYGQVEGEGGAGGSEVVEGIVVGFGLVLEPG